MKKLILVSFCLLTALNSVAQECGYIYVSPTGATAAPAGTRDNPASLDLAFTLITPTDQHFRMAHGEYLITEDLIMQSDLTIEGGFRQSDWVKTNNDVTHIHRTSDNHDVANLALKGIDCQNINNFSLRDLTVSVDDAPGSGVSVYGIYVKTCTQYTISRCILNTGAGSNGTTGQPGTPGINGADGGTGETGEDEGPCCRLGGAGGAGSFPGSNAGGDGGLGAEWGGFEVQEVCVPIVNLCQWIITPLSEFTNPGFPGDMGNGVGAGNGGSGGEGVCEITYANTNCTASGFNHGEEGNDGEDGVDGFDGLQGFGNVIAGYWTPGNGTQGDPGFSHGASGGGGGGGGGKGCEPAALMPYIPTFGSAPYDADTAYNTAGSGAGGGGGGEGGQTGFGGFGGDGAGSSFCVFVYDNGINGVVQDCYFNPGPGGIGGAGGAGGLGGIGGAGGQGGHLGNNGPNNSCNTGEGGDGGAGGDGGIGGDGGQGSDGISEGLYQENGVPVLDPNIYNPWEPDIEVEYFGCTNSMVTVSTNATGNINWIFGFGAEPMNSENQQDTVFYSSPTGYRSITLIVEGVPYFYANYVEIRDEFDPPEIEADRTTICVGEDITIGTSSPALTYDWTIPGGSITTSDQQNPGLVTFATAGEYEVELITTSCCGTSRATDTIFVLETVEPDLGPDQSACFLGELPILDGNGNDGAVYSWSIDGTPTAGNQQYLETTVTGEYVVDVSYGPGCSGTDTVLVSIYTESPVDLGGTTAICAGQSLPILDAGVPNADYAWTLDGNPIGQNQQTLEVFVPGEYQVQVTEVDGCTGDDMAEVIVSNPFVDLGPDLNHCENNPYPTIDAGNTGVDYDWFFMGDSITTGSLFQPNAPGVYTVVMTNQYGCEATDDIGITLFPALNAAFTGPTTATFGTPVQFNDGTPGATSWQWNFGDGSPVDMTQNPNHSFLEVGIRPVFLIAGNGLCADTAYSEVDVQWDCATLTLSADFTTDVDTVILSASATVTVTNNSVGADAYDWDFGDGTPLDHEENPTHAYGVPGNYTITLLAINYNCTTSFSVPITVVQFGVGIEEALDGSLSVYPNPSTGEFILDFDLNSQASGFIQISDELGKVILQEPFAARGGYLHPINLSRAESGLYHLMIQTENGIHHTKLLLIK